MELVKLAPQVPRDVFDGDARVITTAIENELRCSNRRLETIVSEIWQS
jgi:hypothetical protein